MEWVVKKIDYNQTQLEDISKRYEVIKSMTSLIKDSDKKLPESLSKTSDEIEALSPGSFGKSVFKL